MTLWVQLESFIFSAALQEQTHLVFKQGISQKQLAVKACAQVLQKSPNNLDLYFSLYRKKAWQKRASRSQLFCR